MAKGAGQKPDFTKQGEKVAPKIITNDDLSPVDKGHDFVKAGETAHISNK